MITATNAEVIPMVWDMENVFNTVPPLKSPRKTSMIERLIPYNAKYIQNNCPSYFLNLRSESIKRKIIKLDTEE
jgi:hypothetical protein